MYARHLLKEWAKAQPSRHTSPMPWIASLTLGNWLGLQGLPRVGALLVLQSRTGVRPGELLQISQDDLRPHWLAATGAGERQVATISLGMRHGTMLQRLQWISVDVLELR